MPESMCAISSAGMWPRVRMNSEECRVVGFTRTSERQRQSRVAQRLRIWSPGRGGDFTLLVIWAMIECHR